LLILLLPTAIAYYAVPGSRIPLVLDGYRYKTSTLIFPADWKPTHVKWLLVDPYGDTVYWKDSPLDSVSVADSGYDGIYHYTVWEISENTGFMQIPAFAEEGEWKLKIKLYDRFLIVNIEDRKTIYTIPVKRESFLDDLNAPIYFIVPMPLMEDIPVAINFTLFVCGILILILLVVGILILREVKK